MKFIVIGKNIEVTDSLREKVIKKLGKVERFFSPDTEAHITMSVEKARQILEVTILFHGVVFRAEVATEDMYASIDKAVDILERQISKNRTKLFSRFHNKGIKAEAAFEGIEKHTEEEYRVVKSKKFDIKPMTVDEAILLLNLIGHEFYVFNNAETSMVNVVYKRKDGDYGLMEPEN